jgi:hypothetical protein
MDNEALDRFIEAARARFRRTWDEAGDLLPAIPRSHRNIVQSRTLLDRLSRSSDSAQQRHDPAIISGERIGPARRQTAHAFSGRTVSTEREPAGSGRRISSSGLVR